MSGMNSISFFDTSKTYPKTTVTHEPTEVKQIKCDKAE